MYTIRLSAIIIAFFLGLLILAGSIRMLSDRSDTVISPLADAAYMREDVALAQASEPTTAPSDKAKPSGGLATAVTSALSGTSGTYAIAVRHLSTNESYAYNDRRSFPTASLYKLWIMATAYGQIENGELAEDTVLSGSVSELNRIFNISPEYAERTEGSVTYPVRQAIEQMITISHNYAAMLLTKQVKLANVRTFLSGHNLTDSAPGEPPVTTASDIADFFQQLYRGTLAGKESTDKMLATLKNQTLNEKLPKLLPDTIAIAHKTGELDGLSHDAGIVYGKKGPYVIVVLSESANPSAANERIARISKAVYDYFEKN